MRRLAHDKSFLGRKPLTRVRLTVDGRQAFAVYLEAISRLVGEAKPGPTGPRT